MRVAVETDQGEVGVVSLHLRTPRHGLERLYDRKAMLRIGMQGVTPLEAEIERRRRETAAARQWVDSFSGPSIVMGDFNMSVQSTIYRREWSDRTNAFSAAGFGFGYTKRTPIRALEGVDYGVRIDHVLTDPAQRVLRCWVGPDVVSDHLPVCADVELRRAAKAERKTIAASP
jgi:endonuclease/exonuclease/phosphatase family metal-dependent hydrolase